MQVEQMECEHCHQQHAVVGRVGEVPIVHCPTISPSQTQMIVGDHSKEG